MTTILIETDEKHLPMFRAVAKAVDAKVSTPKKPKTGRILAKIEEGLKDVARIQRGEIKPMTLEEALYGK